MIKRGKLPQYLVMHSSVNISTCFTSQVFHKYTMLALLPTLCSQIPAVSCLLGNYNVRNCEIIDNGFIFQGCLLHWYSSLLAFLHCDALVKYILIIYE